MNINIQKKIFEFIYSFQHCFTSMSLVSFQCPLFHFNVYCYTSMSIVFLQCLLFLLFTTKHFCIISEYNLASIKMIILNLLLPLHQCDQESIMIGVVWGVHLQHWISPISIYIPPVNMINVAAFHMCCSVHQLSKTNQFQLPR